MKSPFSHIAPEVVQQVMPRRAALRKAGQFGIGTALATLPVLSIVNRALAATGQTIAVHGVLNFALTLEYLEESFYRQGLAASGLIPAADRPVFEQIQKHEAAHVQTLRGAILAIPETPVEFSDDDFDFTLDGLPNPFSDYPTFMALAQGFEDTGVRAYKGQAPGLYSNGMRVNPTLTVALQIHSVEARHASEVRRMREPAQKGWVGGDGLQGLPAGYGFEAIYAGEANLTHGGVNVDNESTVSTQAVTEAFDEPLTREEVIAIVDPFVIPPLS